MKNEIQGENETVIPDLPILEFISSEEFSSWLAEHYKEQSGIWIRLFKIKSGIPSVTYAEALDVFLCYGWIDGQKKACDTQSWLQKFTPRRSKSIWSQKTGSILNGLKDQD
ncbi:MAG: hypothetical protein H7329_12380 [Opitutaceae bacterium]|nr:hypothetical protein [Cytophagales bacterium]